jgi:DNA-binding MarR family transcriptional regulator
MSQTPTSAHLIAFSHLLARDKEAGSLNTRDLQAVALMVAQGVPLTVGQIAALLTISSPTCSRLLHKLVRRGLLRHAATSPLDRRLVRLEPTPAGCALDRRVNAHYHAAAPANAA